MSASNARVVWSPEGRPINDTAARMVLDAIDRPSDSTAQGLAVGVIQAAGGRVYVDTDATIEGYAGIEGATAYQAIFRRNAWRVAEVSRPKPTGST